MARRQGTYWIGTISSEQGWIPRLPDSCCYLKGQEEEGEGGFRHHQIFFITSKKKSIIQIKDIFGICGPGGSNIIGHWELTRSKAAEDYVWKEESRIGEQYEFGERPFKRNCKEDWEEIKSCAQTGDFEAIPGDVYIKHYNNLCRIRTDHLQPTCMDRACTVFWGPTDTGKSHRAWRLAGPDVFSKDPRSKFWDGYTGQRNVIIDEFRGTLDVTHLLRWLDKYPCFVEVKGSSKPLMATQYYITSNIPPEQWYPELDAETTRALMRRLNVIHVTEKENLQEYEESLDLNEIN